MEKKIKISISKNINKKIFKFLNLSSGTKRSLNSFKENKIIFLIAQRENDIIGCVPLEQRNIKLKKKIQKTFFITNAFVLKKFQNLGIGSKILKYYNKKFKIPLYAFRALSKDQASKWYIKNSFKNVYGIFSYRLNLNKFKKNYRIIDFEKKNFEHLKLINRNKKKILKIVNNRKSNFSNNRNLYFNNYYVKFFKKTFIFFRYSKLYHEFCTISLTNLGNKKHRYEIIDNNFNYQDLLKFLYFFINSKFFNKKYTINLKVNNNYSNFKKIKFFFSKNNYKSNLITNHNLKNNKHFFFNSIEYV